MPDEEACPNPLLLEWVKEWLDTARERSSKGVTTYRNAYNALKACPIAFEHPSQLQQLKGFGPKLCDRLTEKLQKHCNENGIPMPENPSASRRQAGSAAQGAGAEDGDARPAKKTRKAKPYVPTLRSGAYALLVGLASLGQNAPVGMTKAELIEVAQPHCDSSFTAPSDPTKFYTAWSSMKTLIEKELVYERGRPLKRYALTDEGWEVAGRIQQSAAPNQPSLVPSMSNDPNRPAVPHESNSISLAAIEEQRGRSTEYAHVVEDGPAEEASAIPSFRPIRLAPGSFSVQLVLDVREVRAKTDRDYMQEELTKKGVKPTMRSLELGDALWVAKVHDSHYLQRNGSEGDEIVLDWIVERKRLDDLIGSIKDGRFHEQKFRLKRSGVKNVIYIIEDISLDSTFQKYEEAVQSAIASTQVVNGYFVKRTQKMDDTIRYLTRMTLLLKKQYENKTLLVIPTGAITAQNYLPLLEHLREKEPESPHYISYPAFSSLASKSDMMTLRDLYLKMLMCTKQVTGERAIEIQKRWKTPYDFVKAFEGCGSGEEGKKRKRELVFHEMGALVGRKKIAKTLSAKIAEIWADV